MKLLSAFALTLLVGCASLPDGVRMTEEERAACREKGCSVWTEQELQGLAMQFFRQGFARGAQANGRAL
jgi:hypothetical protein